MPLPKSSLLVLHPLEHANRETTNWSPGSRAHVRAQWEGWGAVALLGTLTSSPIRHSGQAPKVKAEKGRNAGPLLDTKGHQAPGLQAQRRRQTLPHPEAGLGPETAGAATSSVAGRCLEVFPKQAAMRHGFGEGSWEDWSQEDSDAQVMEEEAELHAVLGTRSWKVLGGDLERSPGWGQCCLPGPGPLSLPLVAPTSELKKREPGKRGQVTGIGTRARPAGPQGTH